MILSLHLFKTDFWRHHSLWPSIDWHLLLSLYFEERFLSLISSRILWVKDLHILNFFNIINWIYFEIQNYTSTRLGWCNHQIGYRKVWRFITCYWIFLGCQTLSDLDGYVMCGFFQRPWICKSISQLFDNYLDIFIIHVLVLIFQQWQRCILIF